MAYPHYSTTTPQNPKNWLQTHLSLVFWASGVLLLLLTLWLTWVIDITTIPENTQAVEVKAPWVFGNNSCGNTLTGPATLFHATSTRYEPISLASFAKAVAMDDVPTKDGYLLDFRLGMTFRLTDATPVICSSVGRSWFDTFINQAVARASRQAIARTSFTSILTSTETQTRVDQELTSVVQDLIKEHKLPVVLIQLNLGKVTPDSTVAAQMNRTTAQIEAQKTAIEAERTEKARLAGETARAAADSAYVSTIRKATGFSVPEFLLSEQIKACTQTKGTCVIGMPHTSVSLPSSN